MRKSFGLHAVLALAALGTAALQPLPKGGVKGEAKVRRYRPSDDPLAAERRAHNDAVDAKKRARKAGRA